MVYYEVYLNLNHLNSYVKLDEQMQLESPIWHIHEGNPPPYKTEISFNSILNLASICNSNDKKIIWGFIKKYDPSLSENLNPLFDKLIEYSLNYYSDFVSPNKKFLKISKDEKIIFEDILDLLENQITSKNSSEEIQTKLYDIGKKYKFENLKDFFKLVYQVLLGQEKGPRLGSFIKLYGINETINSIKKILNK